MSALARIDYRPQPGSNTDVPAIVFCTGFHSNMRGDKAEYLDRWSRERRIPCHRFDYRGHGESPGDVVDCNLHHWLEDTLSVLDSIPQRIVLVGSSMGAWLATLAASERPTQVQALLLLAAAPDFTESLLLPGLDDKDRAALESGERIVIENGHDSVGWPLCWQLFESGRALSILGAAASRLAPINCPVRLIHGTADTDVPWHYSQRLLEALPHDDVHLLLLKGADHRLSDPQSLHTIGLSLDVLCGAEHPC